MESKGGYGFFRKDLMGGNGRVEETFLDSLVGFVFQVLVGMGFCGCIENVKFFYLDCFFDFQSFKELVVDCLGIYWEGKEQFRDYYKLLGFF